jgi:hypothetical protein
MASANLITFQTILTYLKKISNERVKLYLLENYFQNSHLILVTL